jgi:predicted dehydrogenase
MSNNVKNRVVLIGTGPMAIDHVKVLKELDTDIVVVGRGEESAKLFEEQVGIKPITGGVEKYLNNHPLNPSDYVLIATGSEVMISILLLLAKQSFQKVLVEKPAALSIDELLENKEELQAIKDKVFVGYNRRFYASVMEAQKLIEEDGGLKSMHFEFTEWAHKIAPLKKPPGVKENWFLTNSSHVVDLSFFLAGNPKDWSSYMQQGELDWHPKSNFSGAGITDKNVVFSYISNWESAGRWGIELMTYKRRIYLKPLEEVQIQDKGTIAVYKHETDLSIDEKFKPGLYQQTVAFFEGDERLPSLGQYFVIAKEIFSKVLNGERV